MANVDIDSWIREVAAHTRPSNVRIIMGTFEEAEEMRDLLMATGKLIRLNHASFPRAYLYRSDVNDVARTEHCTFICCKDPVDAGPTNNWKDPTEAKNTLLPMFKDIYAGKEIYVIPYILGPRKARLSKVGVQITDSPYVVLNYLGRMYRTGQTALNRIRRGETYVRSLHSKGSLDPAKRFICHFIEERLVISINSEYGGNAILAKKSDGLRMRSVDAINEGWHAEHMATFRVTFPDGETLTYGYMGPSGCAKTNSSTQNFGPGYLTETVCEDISYFDEGDDGRLHVIAPESGAFAILAGINPDKSPAMFNLTQHDTIFTNAAYDPVKNEPWWEGCGRPAPEGLIAWDGTPWSPDQNRPAAHKNSRITSHISQLRTAGASYDDPDGIPLDVILFATRSTSELPLIYEPYSWQHAVYAGMTMVSETTDAVGGPVGVPRFDSFAMTPFCGTNMAYNARNWLRTGQRLGDRVPLVMCINLFRKNAAGEFTFPGFEQTRRVHEYTRQRLHLARGLSVNGGNTVATPLGYVPAPGALDLSGLNFSPEQERALHALNPEHLARMVKRNAEYFRKFGDKLPEELWQEQAAFEQRVALGM